MAALTNARKENFVQYMIQGMSQRKAYKAAFPTSERWKDATVDNKASELFKDHEILGRYKELQEEAKDEAIMKRIDRMVVLSEIAEDKEEKTDARIKAIDTLNKMDGVYTSNVNISGNVNNPFESMTEEQLKKLAGYE